MIIIYNIFSHQDNNIKEGIDTLNTKYAAVEKSNGFGGTGQFISQDVDFDRMNYKYASTDASLNELTNYSADIGIRDVDYHDTPEQIAKTTDFGLEIGTVWLFDPILQKKVAITRPIQQSYSTYYTPGEYKYGSKSYVPTYEDSIKLRTRKFTLPPPP
jgi:hypothetical protein